MKSEIRYTRLLMIAALALLALCLAAGALLGIAVWFRGRSAQQPPRTAYQSVPETATSVSWATATTLPPTVTPPATLEPTPTPSPSATATAIPTLTLTPVPPTPTSTTTPMPATDTPVPEPTSTPLPTDTPVPAYPFALVENDTFSTGKPDLDVFVAVTDADNHPLSGYRILAGHSSGLQVESEISAGEWTENSGAGHYKAGNIKIHVADAPGGVWTFHLVDEGSSQVASDVELPFDPAAPNWYFVIYQRSD